MRNLIVIIASVAVLSGAYFYAFGVPPAVASLVTGEVSDSAEAPAQPAGQAQRGSRTTTVVLSSLEERSYALVLRTIGTATALRGVDIVASEAGTAVEVMLQANALVDEGDVLVRLDDRAEQLALDIAEAELDQAQTTVDRYETLGAAGNLTISNVSVAEAEVALRLAQANVGLAEVALADRVIRAPIAGQLGLSDLTVGDYLSADEAIVSVVDSSTILAEFEVPERSIALLEPGKPVLIGTPTYAGRVFEGSIVGFDSQLDSVTRSATVRAEIDNADGLLVAGMSLSVRMLEDTPPLPVVPSTAITWDRSGAGIWVSDNGRVSRQPVTIRYREGDQVWIETDIPLETQIVTEGAAKLRDGAAVADAGASGAPS